MIARLSRSSILAHIGRQARAGLRQPGGRLWLAAVGVWLALLIATPIGLWTAGERSFPLLASLGVLAQAAATLLALAGCWSPGRLAITVAGVVAFTWAVEALGASTGVPFGRYEYTAALQPQLANVPLLIPLAWLMMLGPAWGVAALILEPLRARAGRWYWPLYAGLSALAFTAWDLYLDPQMTARGLWEWLQPGGYFGIPWVNYAGWLASSALITLLVRPADLPASRLLAIYTLTWLFQAVGLGVFWGQPGPALAGFAGMGLFALWAWAGEFRAWKRSSGHSLHS